METFLGAGIQVVAFIVGMVCLISTILGKPYGIGPVTVPGPSRLLQRVTLGLVGVCLVFLAVWPLLSPNKSIIDEVTVLFSRPTAAPTLGPPDKLGAGVQPWFTIGSERIAISAVQSPGASGLYFRNVGTQSIHIQFDATSDCPQASCHSGLDVIPIDHKSPAAQDATIACATDGHLSFDMPDAPRFTWKIWLGNAMSPASC